MSDTDTPDTAPREAQEATDAPEDAQGPQEQQQPQEDAQDAQEDADAPEDASDDQTDAASEDSAAGKARRESAKYRRRLREVEGDQLAGQVHDLQRAAAVAAAQGPGRLADGADLFRDDHVQLADLVADDGAVDIDRVAAAAAAVLGRSPHWRHTAPRPTGRPVEALQLNPHGDPPGDWSDVLRGAS